MSEVLCEQRGAVRVLINHDPVTRNALNADLYAALTAALTGVGVPTSDALSAVFLFRLLTYWLPVPFGWGALHRLQRTVVA